jgi:hypothetical protein
MAPTGVLAANPPPSGLLCETRHVTLGFPHVASLHRRVRFASVTEYEFALGHGGSSIPSENGPSVGLIGSPIRVTATELKHCNRRTKKRCLRKYGRQERVEILKKAGYPMKKIIDFCVEALDIRLSRGSNRRNASRKRSKAMSSTVRRNTEINASTNISFCED